MRLHVYRYPAIPATRSYFIPGFEREDGTRIRLKGFKPHVLVRCHHCLKLRRAKNIMAQHYYDQSIFRCRPGLDCPKPLRSERRRGWA
jgi:hypothetical protein